MKKVLILCLSMLLVFAVVGCQKAETNNAGQYSVTILNDYPIKNQLKASYQAGEKVTVELDTVTEQYYVFCVNDMVCEPSKSDLSSTYFTFTMPNENVVIDIYTMGVDIPTAPQYALTVTEGAWMLYEQPNEKYSLGTQVVLKVDMAWDVSIVCLVNGEGIGEPTEEDDNGTPYLRFEFTMPNENVNIELIMFDNEGFTQPPDDDYPSEGKYELETDEQEQIRLILLRKDGMWLGMPECEWSWAFEVKDSDGTKLDLHLCRCHTIIDMTNRRSVTLFDSEYQQILDILSNHKEPSGHGPVIHLMYYADNKVIKELTEDENNILMDILKSDGWKAGLLDCDFDYIFDFENRLFYRHDGGLLYDLNNGRYLTLNAEQLSRIESILNTADT